MKKLIPFFLMALVVVACDKIEGQLNVTKEFKLVSTGNQANTIKLGSYNADIRASSNNKITLRLNNDVNQKYVFNHNGNIPSNGTFTIPASTSGQPVDLNGAVTTKITETPVKQMYESCTYQRPVQVCNPTPNGGVVCNVMYQTVFGSHYVSFFDRTTEKNVVLTVRETNSQEDSADFHGNAAYLDRIILNQTQCM